MKLKIIFTAMLAATLTACEPAPTGFSAADRTAIEQASQNWVDTYNRNDWPALAGLFAPDAIMMPPNSPAMRGRAAIAAWEQANEAGFRIAFDVQAIEGSGDVAYVRGRSCVFIPTGADGPNGTGEYGVDVGKFLEVRRRQSSGAWLIEADIFNSNLAVGADLSATCPFANSPEAD